MQNAHILLILAQLKWTGHVTRMPDAYLSKKILYVELQVGKRYHGGQKKRYKDTLKSSLKDFNIPTAVVGTDCTGKWQGLIRRSAGEYGARRISEAEQECVNGKPELRHHQQSFLSLELRLVSTAILQHTNNNTQHALD